jgi:hypothetical protein
MDEFKLDPALLVSPLEKRSRYLDLWEGAMKHDGPLYQGEVSPLIKRSLVAQVVDMMCLQFNPLASLNRPIFQFRFNAKFDEVSDS